MFFFIMSAASVYLVDLLDDFTTSYISVDAQTHASSGSFAFTNSQASFDANSGMPKSLISLDDLLRSMCTL